MESLNNFLYRLTSQNQFVNLYLLFEKVLLRSNDGAGPADAYPGNRLRCCETIMLHQVAAYQSARPTKPRCAERVRMRILTHVTQLYHTLLLRNPPLQWTATAPFALSQMCK